MKSRISLILSAVAVVAMCVFIFVMSSFPAEQSDALSTGVIWHIVGFIVPGYDQMSPAEQLQWQEALQFPVRKTAHFLEYALLGFLMMNLVMRLPRLREKALLRVPILPRLRDAARVQQAIVAWLLCIAYSITDEIHQEFVPGRTGMIMDVGIDAAGSLVGIAILLLIVWLVERRRRTRLR